MKTFKIYIESTFATTEKECRDKLNAISNYPEIKDNLNRIDIGAATKTSEYGRYCLNGYCAFMNETD